MIVIFGIRRKACRLATVFALCRLCGSPAAQAITRVRTFFSIFFVPLVPLGSSYRSTCTLCGRTVKLTKADADEAVAQSEAAARSAPLPPPTVPSAPYPPPAMPPGPPSMLPRATPPTTGP